jgi:uncharacterized protein YxjI
MFSQHASLTYRFKLIAIASQLAVTAPNGEEVLYVRQKLLKLRESVNVHASEAQQSIAYTINADRVLDFNARYQITSREGRSVGAIRRRGVRSLFSAHYEIEDDFGRVGYDVKEANPWVKFLDGLFESIPVVGWLSGYLLHPEYLVQDAHGRTVASFAKRPALFEGVYEYTRAPSMDESDAERIALSLAMMVLLERARG